MDWDKHLPSVLAWGGSIATGIFTLLGAYLASRSTLQQLKVKHQHEADRERRESLRVRLEELYTMINRWAGDVVVHHTTYRKVMYGELTYNQALDFTIANESKFDVARMFTVADLYFPAAHQSLESLKSLRDRAAEIQTDYKHFYQQAGQPSSYHAEHLTSVLEQFNAAIDQYKQDLAQHAYEM